MHLWKQGAAPVALNVLGEHIGAVEAPLTDVTCERGYLVMGGEMTVAVDCSGERLVAFGTGVRGVRRDDWSIRRR